MEIGYLAKPHGLKGEIEAVLTTNLLAERTSQGSVFWCGLNNDQSLELSSARPKGDRWLLRFSGFNSRDDVESLRGLGLFAKPLPSFMTHDLFGCHLVDQHGVDHGEIVSIHANPASDLVELSSGKLVPMVFFQKLDNKIANFEIQKGLFESQDN